MAAIPAATAQIPLHALDVPSEVDTIQHHNAIHSPGGGSRDRQATAAVQLLQQNLSQVVTSSSDNDDNAAPVASGPCPATSENNAKAKSVFSFLVGTRVGNAIALIGLLATLGPTLFQGITSYMDMKWSEHANAVQTCASLYVCPPITLI
jgi:hypothetical protein